MRVVEMRTLPDVTGVDALGRDASLSEHFKEGRYLLAWWHPQALSPLACKTCQGGAEPIQTLIQIHEAGCDVVGLSYESPERLAGYLREIGLEYPLISVDRDAARLHGVAKAPGEPWESIPSRVAFLTNSQGDIINRYEVHDPNVFLRSVLADVKAGPPASQWKKPKRGWRRLLP